MPAEAWLQLALTTLAMVVSMVVFYFKSEGVLRKEILASEERLRGDIGKIRDNVSQLDTRVAVIEAIDAKENMAAGGRTRMPTNPGRY